MNELSTLLPFSADIVGIFGLMLSAFLIGYFSALWLHRTKYHKTIDRLKKEVNLSKTDNKIRDIETIFTEIKPRIAEMVKQTQEEISPQKPQEVVAQQARTSYISYHKKRPELDFDSFGYADYSDKDDLTKIGGIGPYIEQKLNEIGIYTFDQISKLNDSDIRIITDLIDFFPGRIERDNWVGQAKALTAVY
ncbi:MAG: hypothetical protein CMC08_05375 [Flavobacteriaceae bacterium]|nr:hypothetical protein [Flavobacteriaceae bacterium]